MRGRDVKVFKIHGYTEMRQYYAFEIKLKNGFPKMAFCKVELCAFVFNRRKLVELFLQLFVQKIYKMCTDTDLNT